MELVLIGYRPGLDSLARSIAGTAGQAVGDAGGEFVEADTQNSRQ